MDLATASIRMKISKIKQKEAPVTIEATVQNLIFLVYIPEGWTSIPPSYATTIRRRDRSRDSNGECIACERERNHSFTGLLTLLFMYK